MTVQEPEELDSSKFNMSIINKLSTRFKQLAYVESVLVITRDDREYSFQLNLAAPISETTDENVPHVVALDKIRDDVRRINRDMNYTMTIRESTAMSLGYNDVTEIEVTLPDEAVL